jgi:hypothetical protein
MLVGVSEYAKDSDSKAQKPSATVRKPTPANITLDYDAVDQRVARRRPNLPPQDMGSYVPPAPGTRTPAPKAAPVQPHTRAPMDRAAPPVIARPRIAAYTAKRPKALLLSLALLLLLATGGFFTYRYIHDQERAEELLAPVEALAQSRDPLYANLVSSVTARRQPRNDYCPPLGDPRHDSTFHFEGAPLVPFPTQTRVQRERAAFEAVDDGRSSESTFLEGLQALEQIGPAVLQVRVLSWRAPEIRNRGGSESRAYDGVVPGYVIGDAFVGSGQSGAMACSFRFFAASSRSITRRTSPGRDLAEDLGPGCRPARRRGHPRRARRAVCRNPAPHRLLTRARGSDRSTSLTRSPITEAEACTTRLRQFA